eukprot:jgi/Botrbrau1/18604/Bobra.0367s0044.1
MTGSGLRHRRYREEDSEELQEPLLQTVDSVSDDEDYLDSKGHTPHHSALVPHSINRLDWQLLWQAIVESCTRSWSSLWVTLSSCLGSMLPHQEPLQLSLVQQERLQALRERIQVPFDPDDPDHEAALKQLWEYAFPRTPFRQMVDDKWTEMGWQRNDPRTDFRGGGFTALENHLYMAENEMILFRKLLEKADGERSEWEYPFAVAGINVTFMLEELVEMRDGRTGILLVDRLPVGAAAHGFIGLLNDGDKVFEQVYCIAYELLDKEWLQMRASYMDFSSVMKRVRAQLAAALATKPETISRLRDLLLRPA